MTVRIARLGARFARLPKWAKDFVVAQEREIYELHKRIEQLRVLQRESRVTCGEVALPQDTPIRFHFSNGDQIEVWLKYTSTEVLCVSSVRGGTLSLKPVAANWVEVRTER